MIHSQELIKFIEKLDDLPSKGTNTVFFVRSQGNWYRWDSVLEAYKQTSEGSSATYTNLSPSTFGAGAIPIGSTFDSESFSSFIDRMFYAELFPTLTNPSSTFVSSISGFREIGELLATISFNSGFNRGSISPQYESESPFRSGLPNEYIYSGAGLVSQEKTDLTDTRAVNNYTVLSGNQSWTGRVAYDAGVQPKGSKGTDFNSPLIAGLTNVITRTITGVYPTFATFSDITVMSKRFLSAHGSEIIVDMVAENPTDKQSLEVPTIWGNLTQIAQWNELSSQYDIINMATFTETAITKDVQGSNIDYKKFTHNGSQIGARRLRFTF